jgi:DmsE family decaheme c-type cytochrome
MRKKGEPMTKYSKKLRKWVWLLALPLLQLGAGVAFAQKQPAEAAPTSVSGQAVAQADTSTLTGTQACLHCHRESSEHVMKTAHSGTYDQVLQGVPKTSASTGCDGCHGSSKAHADAELEAERTDTKNPEAKKLIFDFESKSTTPEMINQRCLTCHASGPSHLDSANSFHRQNEVSCIDCHSPHHAATKEKLLIKAQPELCYSCHLQQKSQFDMAFHHRVNEGLIQCTDCHNQHGTAGVWESDHLVRQVRTSDNGDAVCFKCHKDKQGPFVFPHASVKVEGCAACHIPHGGANVHMLKYSNVNLLCLQCHTAAHFGPVTTAGNNGKPTGFGVMNGPVPNNAIYIQACTMCHTQIHGSNFSDIFFR